MGKRLKNLKAKLIVKEISDGKSLKYRPTDIIIDELQNYSRNAIMENSGDLNAMKQAVWAIFYHRISTNEKPIHALCPPSPNTWCRYGKTEAGTLDKYTHKHSVPEAVMQ